MGPGRDSLPCPETERSPAQSVKRDRSGAAAMKQHSVGWRLPQRGSTRAAVRAATLPQFDSTQTSACVAGQPQ